MDCCRDSSASAKGSTSASVMGGVATLLLKTVWESLPEGLEMSKYVSCRAWLGSESGVSNDSRFDLLSLRGRVVVALLPTSSDVSGVMGKPTIDLVFVSLSFSLRDPLAKALRSLFDTAGGRLGP